MSAEASIQTYSDRALKGAYDQLSRHPLAGMASSWEGDRLRLLAKELRTRKAAEEEERRAE